MLLQLGIAVGSGLLNAMSGSAEDKEIQKRKQQAMALLRENIIDPAELDTMLSNVNRLFNNRLTNTLNSTAIRSRGVSNSGVVKGLVAGQIEGDRLGTIVDTEYRASESNKQTRAQMAQTELQYGNQHTFMGDFLGGALAGLPAGNELSKMLGNQDSSTNTTSAVPDPYNPDPQASNMQNPFLNKFKIQDEDIYNFGYKKFWNN